MNDTITFNPAMQATDPAAAHATKAAHKCVNLRLSTEGSAPCLSPTGEPLKLCDATLAEPYCTFTDSGSHSSLLFLEGTNLYSTGSGNGRRLIASLPSQPGAAIADGDTLKLLTAEGVRHITADPATGTLTDRGVMPRMPDIRFVTHTTGRVSAGLPPLRLTGGYVRCQGSLTGTDLAMLARQLDGMYESLYTQASAMELALQPRLMAWRLFDGQGNVLTRSVPIWVAPGGFQCTGAVTGIITKDDSGTFTTVTGIKAEATAYATRLRIDGSMADPYWKSQCRTLEILAGPQLHPVTASGMTVARMDSIDSATGQLTAYMPGAGAGSLPASLPDEVADALALFDTTAEVIAVYHDPLDLTGAAHSTLAINPKADAATERNDWQTRRRKASGHTDAPGSIAALCSQPNGFMARTVYNSGDTLMLADITPLRHHGFTPSVYSVSNGIGEFRQTSLVEYSSNGSAVTYSTAADDAPDRISPLIVTPFPDASAITLAVEHGGTVRSQRFPLRQSGCGRYSYYLAGSLDTLVMPESSTALSVPPARTVTSRHGGALIVAHPRSPLTPISTVDFGGAPIVAVTPPAGSASAWDFARRHATAWSADAIRTLSVDNSRRVLSTTIVHPCGPVRSDAVTVTPHGIYAAMADGSMILLKGSKVTVPHPAKGVVVAGYCAPYDELWTADADGSVTVTSLQHPESCYTRTFGPVSCLYAAYGRLYAATSSGVYDASCEGTGSTDAINVAWSMRLRTRRHRSLRQFVMWLQSPQASVTAELRGDGGAGSGESYPLLTLRAEGPVNAPLRARMASPWRPYITLRFSGTLAPGSSVSGGEVEFG